MISYFVVFISVVFFIFFFLLTSNQPECNNSNFDYLNIKKIYAVPEDCNKNPYFNPDKSNRNVDDRHLNPTVREKIKKST